MLRSRSVWLGMLVALCCAVLAGCSNDEGGAPVPGVAAQGRLLDGGQPATLDDYQDGYLYYQVTFVPESGGAGMVRSVGEDGTFPITGIEAGSYKVGVQKIVDAGAEQPDEWQGKYSAETSPVTVQIDEGKEVTIELNDVMGSAAAAPAAE